MSDKLKQALKFSNYRTMLNAERIKNKELLNNALKYSEFGGTFSLTEDFIMWVDFISKKDDEGILIDIYDNPILIPHLSKFLATIIQIRSEAMNKYYTEFQRLKKARDTGKVVDW